MQAIDTTVAEFGIACESCHGPGQAHVEANRNPLRRYGLHLARGAGGADDGDPTIVLPTRLDPERSSQACGQCHSVWEFYDLAGERHANRAGLPYRPGDELRDTRFVAQPSVDRDSPEILAFVEDDPGVRARLLLARRHGPGVRPRVQRPHRLPLFPKRHRAGPDADLASRATRCTRPRRTGARSRSGPTRIRCRPTWAGTDACLQCHEPMRADLTAHTRHGAESSGSSCYNCHMPYTSYGLLEDDAEPYDQQSHRGRDRGAGPPERLQPLSSRQDAGLDRRPAT